jgi:succinate-semialdehyde dehydrogenase/glutarate-semialdehyde dehydrogenase
VAQARTERAAKKSAQPNVLESFNPATGELLGTVEVTPPKAVAAIAEETARIQQGWALTPLAERLRIIRRAGQWVLANREELAGKLTDENGKTLLESLTMEVFPIVDTFHWVASWAGRYLSPERIPNPQPYMKHKRHYFLFEPLGVVGIISPWNYPFSIPAGEVALALAAGNAVLLKPSEHTPLIANEIARAFEAGGLPRGVLRVLHGLGDTGAAICEAPAVKKIFFTGSTATGRKIMEAAARDMKPVMLELGGKDAAVVLADADLGRAVGGTMWAGFANAGQTCAGVERVYVDRRIYDEFVERITDLARAIHPGDPRDPATQVGPMTNDMQYDKVVELLDDATASGAELRTGGPTELPGLGGKFIAPVVLTGVDHSMRIMREEIFGPVVPIMPFDSEDEAVALANDSQYGLGASVWTRDTARGRLIGERLQAGMVWVNDHMYSHGIPQTPWGGVKESGTGVTHSKFGLYEMVDKRLLSVDGGRIPVPWWHPYEEFKRRGLSAVLEALYAPELAEKARKLWDRRSDLRELLQRMR